MAVTAFQKKVCRLLARNRKDAGDAYVAGGVALNMLLNGSRVSRDSAYRFFPLIEHEQFGLVLHPFDLATNKCLALAGRLEPRDWVDMITCHNHLQPLGYIVWAACGKDIGFSRFSYWSYRRGNAYNSIDAGIVKPLFSQAAEPRQNVARIVRCGSVSYTPLQAPEERESSRKYTALQPLPGLFLL